MDLLNIDFEFSVDKMTCEEWEIVFKAKELGKKKGVNLILKFFTPRIKKILMSDELQPFEKETEITYGEFLRFKCERGN